MKELNDTLKLLIKPNWNYKEIKSYFGVGTTKSYELIAEARKRGGGIKDMPNCVKRDVLLAMFGTTAEREVSLLNHIKKEEKV